MSADKIDGFCDGIQRDYESGYRQVLTNVAVQNLKPSAKPFKTTDSGGLYVLTTPHGTKAWRLDYRFFGTRKTLALGQYPGISLAEAREKRDAAKKLLSADRDPSLLRKIERIAAKTAIANTFGAVASEFLLRRTLQGRSPATVQKNRWMLEIVSIRLRDRPISEITAAEIPDVLQSVEPALSTPSNNPGLEAIFLLISIIC